MQRACVDRPPKTTPQNGYRELDMARLSDHEPSAFARGRRKPGDRVSQLAAQQRTLRQETIPPPATGRLIGVVESVVGGTQIRTAYVDAGGGEPVAVRVPQHLVDSKTFAVADYPDNDGPSVSFRRESVGGDFVVVDAPGVPLVRDGSFLEGGTVPTSDGAPPSSSPTPTVSGGFGSLFVHWVETR